MEAFGAAWDCIQELESSAGYFCGHDGKSEDRCDERVGQLRARFARLENEWRTSYV